jgi:hypothetical protein
VYCVEELRRTKNKAGDAIPNQNSIHSSSSGALKGKGGGVLGGGALTLPRLAQKAPKKYCVEELRRTKIEQSMRFQTKTRFIALLLGPSRERGGCWGGGPRANHELPHQTRGHPFLYSSRLVCKPILQAK